MFCFVLTCFVGLIELEKYLPAMESQDSHFCSCDNYQIKVRGKKAKSMIQLSLTKIFNKIKFQENGKMQNKCCWALTVYKNMRRCQACSIHKDEKYIRGCWKGKGCVSDVYDNVDLPYPDAKVEAVLCGAGGPCTYVTNPAVDAAMMNSFILSRVVPNVRKRHPESACLVLGKASMWLIPSSTAENNCSCGSLGSGAFYRIGISHVCGGDSI